MYSGSLTSTSISITYGSGSIDGDQITNLAYSIGGLSASMTVMGITSQTTFFTCTNQAQGILGMAYPALAQSIFLLLLLLLFSHDWKSFLTANLDSI